jgi:hypothetical protein
LRSEMRGLDVRNFGVVYVVVYLGSPTLSST